MILLLSSVCISKPQNYTDQELRLQINFTTLSPIDHKTYVLSSEPKYFRNTNQPNGTAQQNYTTLHNIKNKEQLKTTTMNVPESVQILISPHNFTEINETTSGTRDEQNNFGLIRRRRGFFSNIFSGVKKAFKASTEFIGSAAKTVVNTAAKVVDAAKNNVVFKSAVGIAKAGVKAVSGLNPVGAVANFVMDSYKNVKKAIQEHSKKDSHKKSPAPSRPASPPETRKPEKHRTTRAHKRVVYATSTTPSQHHKSHDRRPNHHRNRYKPNYHHHVKYDDGYNRYEPNHRHRAQYDYGYDEENQYYEKNDDFSYYLDENEY